jgi:cell division protein FtsW
MSSLEWSPTGATRGGLRIDGVFLMLVAAIVLLGLVMVGSASINMSSKETGQPFGYLEKQLFLVLGGGVGAAVIAMIPIAWFEKHAFKLLMIAGALLLLVLIPGLGMRINGASRWLRLPGFGFQVSEAARVLTLIYLASYCVRFEEDLRTGPGAFLRALGMLSLLSALLLVEPDFGAATVLLVTGFGLLFLAGSQMRWVLAALALGVLGLVGLVLVSSYRMRRLKTFLDPWADPLKDGFQLTQSLIAIGRGEWFGVGLGASVQKLFYLPEAHNDFLFAVLAEELGLLGVLVTIGLFLALALRVLLLARRAQQVGLKFHSYLAAGFGLWLGVQAFVNMGVNMGVLPTKGLTLPLMSYGRSSLIVTLCWIGLILRVHHEVAAGGRSPKRGAHA